jgi:RHS repeat-associated protein
VTTWQYDVLGRVTTMSYANGAVAENDYDVASRLIALRNLKADRSVISIFTYSHDAVGDRLGVEEANGDLVTWSYDEIYQLIREQRTGDNAYDITYTYDEVGNRLTKLSEGVVTTSSYDAANQLLTAEDDTGITTFSYDANGNTISEEKPSGDLTTYIWDAENHMTNVELPASVVNTITLDGDGKRRTIEDSSGLKKLIWDRENILIETDSDNATTAAYTLAPEAYGSLVSQRRSGATSFHHFDALGSTNKLTDADEATVVEYLYKAFGEQSVLAGSSANPFTWVGKLGCYWQSDSVDYWIRARVLEPVIGRWNRRDPLCGQSGISIEDSNCYVCLDNSPISRNDPSGLQTSTGSDYQHNCMTLLTQATTYLDRTHLNCENAYAALRKFLIDCWPTPTPQPAQWWHQLHNKYDQRCPDPPPNPRKKKSAPLGNKLRSECFEWCKNIILNLQSRLGGKLNGPPSPGGPPWGTLLAAAPKPCPDTGLPKQPTLDLNQPFLISTCTNRCVNEGQLPDIP